MKQRIEVQILLHVPTSHKRPTTSAARGTRGMRGVTLKIKMWKHT